MTVTAIRHTLSGVLERPVRSPVMNTITGQCQR